MVSWTRDILGEDWAGGVIGDAVGDGSTLGVGDGSTLGCGTTLVCGTTLGGVTTLGGGNAVGVVDGGARAVLVFQWAKIFAELGDFRQLLVVDCGGGVLDGAG